MLAGMMCPACSLPVPDVAYHCQRCGADLVSAGQGGRRRFAAKPDEPVASFAIVSSIMPAGAARHPQTYRVAFTIALGVALVAALFGALPIGVLVAALAVPIVYLVYLYDVNLWEDSPLPVTLLAFVVSAGLGALFTWLWTGWMPMQLTLAGASTKPKLVAILLVALLVPAVGELIRQVGPVALASRPAFDDLMDGVTFGIASGVAYAAGDTIVRQWDLLTGGMAGADPGFWAPLILVEGLVKPLLIGTASGLAAAEFSGLGKGYDGFSPRYLVAVGVAVAANAAFGLGTYLLGFVTPGSLAACLQLLLGLVILAALVLRLRRVLQLGLMEGALEAAARSAAPGGATAEIGFCRRCEMPLVDPAKYCNACGAEQAEAPAAAATAPPGEPEAATASTSATGEGK
jgi:hypothetical protein